MRPLPLLLLVLALPGSLGAQAAPPPAQREGASAAASLLLKGTRLAGEDRLMLGGWAGLVLGGRLAVGGAGMALLKRVETATGGAGTGFELGMGYGGVRALYWRDLPLGLTGEAGSLLGAGNAEVRDRLTGTELGADNFFVWEPEVGLSTTLFPGVHLGVTGGYRMTWGVGGLPSVAPNDLRAASATLHLRIGGR